MLIHGDSLEVLPTLDAESIDAIVTDPPYGLEFMGKAWDRLGDIGQTSHAGPSDRDGSTVFGRQRVAYSGSSNRKCGSCRKWEWDYPERKCVCEAPDFPNVKAHQARIMQDWHHAWAVEAFRVAKPGAYLLAFGGTRTVHRLASAIEDAGWEIRDTLVWAYASGFPKSLDVSKAIDKAAGAEREVVGVSPSSRPNAASHANSVGGNPHGGQGIVTISSAATDAAREWQGWGTALKPAWEPIVMARKPLRGTVAGNVQAYGTGALNIDGCRIGTTDDNARRPSLVEGVAPFGAGYEMGGNGSPLGRWPANVILTDPIFDGDTPGVVGGGDTGANGYRANESTARHNGIAGPWGDGSERVYGPRGHDDSGTYSRFFQLPRGESCDWCGAPPVATSSSPRSGADATAPSRVATEPAGTQASMGIEDKSPTASDTNGTGTSTSPEQPPVIVSPLRQGARTAAQPTTSTDTTTTTGSRWTCGHSAGDATPESIPPQPKPTRPELPVDGDDYPFAFIVPKAARSDREPVLGGLPTREVLIGAEGHKVNPMTGRPVVDVPRANVHPTVKPTDLMRHLVRLVTPPGGTVLDPFLGSGTTALAAEMEGFGWVGIEREAEYVAIAEARLNGTQRGLGLVG